jgi:hypothetical protein
VIITAVRHLTPIRFDKGVSDVDKPLSEMRDIEGAKLRCNLDGLRYWSPNKDVPEYTYGFTSPYTRCRQTAKQIQSVAYEWGESTPLRESAHPGQEVLLTHKKLVTVESAFDLRDRVMRFLDFVHDVPCVRVIAVTHGDVLNAFRWCLEGLSLSEFRDLFRDKTNFIPFGCALTWDNGRNTMTKSTLDDGVLDPIAIRLSSEWAYSAIPTNFDKD